MMQPNTGGMDTSGPPSQSRTVGMARMGGNFYRGVAQLEERRAHNPEVVGSNPAPASRLSCQTERLMTARPVETRPNSADQRYGQQAPAQAGISMGHQGEIL